jgi:hypothetical protein
VTQKQSTRVTENSVNHIDRAARNYVDDGIFRPFYVDDGFFRPIYMWMTEFSVTFVVSSCVTLGFCNSVF